MKSTLYLICTVCHSPIMINENVERGLVFFPSIICVHCKQTNIITREVRNHVTEMQKKG